MEHFTIRTRKTPQINTKIYNDAFGLDADKVLSCAYSSEGTFYCGTEQGLFYYEKDRFVKIITVRGAVSCIYGADDGIVYASVGNTVFTVIGSDVIRSQELKEDVISIEADDTGKLWLISKTILYQLNGNTFEILSDIEFGCSDAFTACGDRCIYVCCDRALMMLHGKRPRWGSMMRELTNIPSAQMLSLASDKYGHIFVGCTDGLHIYDGRSEWLGPDKLNGFPKCAVTKIVLGKSGNVYLGTEIGLYTVNGAKTRFYGKGRYLAADKVLDIAVSDDEKEIWVATEGGISSIKFTDMSLAEKEAYFDSVMNTFKRENYVTKREHTVNGDFDSGFVSITDNDGLWTAVYVAAMAIKYNVTGSENALENARRSMKALVKLITMTGISGFPARAYRRPGEDLFGNGDVEWHASSDAISELEWKGETSSDELVGHYYALSWYYDLCADDDEKKIIAEAIKSITDHILTHDYTLCDVDGLPTTWAHFGPEELCLDDKWCWEKGINSLELLSFLRITEHVTDDKKYADEAERLITKYHYAMNTLTYKMYDYHACHIDDKLGFYIITCLLRYENDPDILRFIKLALRRHFEYEKIENNPYFAFVNAFYTGAHSDLTAAIETLEEYPVDLRCYPVHNSIRPDIEIETRTEYYGDRPNAKYGIPACERVMDCMEYDALQLDGKRDNNIVAPTSWLLSYWIGKYFGIIE